MRNALIPLLFLGAACSSTETVEVPDVEVTASEEAEGTRVQFQLNKGNVTAHDIKLTAENGQLLDICRSHDLRRVSVLWTRAEGTLTCVFPYGQTAEWESSGEVLRDKFDYVFFQGDKTRVSAVLPRGAPMRPRLLLAVEIPSKDLPGKLQWKGREVRHLVKPTSLIGIKLPMNERNVLETGDWPVTLETKSGKHEFLIGVDKDGTPSASSGYVQRAGG